MAVLRTCLLLSLAACRVKSALGEVSGGYTRAWSGDDTGIVARAALGVEVDGPGAGPQLSVRTGADSSEVAIGVHVFSVLSSGSGGAFVRAGVNLLEWDRVGSDDNIGALGPSLQLGFGLPAGPCMVASLGRDVRLFHPDDTFVGISVGLCGISRRSRR